MDSFGVPKKVNRHLIKALTSLTCGLPNFYVTFENVMDEARYQMRNLAPIENEEQVFKMALINLCNIGIIKSHDNECALASFGRIIASEDELLKAFPPKSTFKNSIRNSKTTAMPDNTIKSVKKNVSSKRNKPLSVNAYIMKRRIGNMCPVCTIYKKMLTKRNYTNPQSIKPSMNNTFALQKKPVLNCYFNGHLNSSTTNTSIVEGGDYKFSEDFVNGNNSHTDIYVGCGETSEQTEKSNSTPQCKSLNSILIRNEYYQTKNCSQSTSNSEPSLRRFRSLNDHGNCTNTSITNVERTDSSQMNRDDFMKRYYTCDISPFYLN